MTDNKDNNGIDLDLNIDNYSFADVLRLFRLDGSKPVEDRDLKRCRATVDKLHPSRSSLSGAYYELFNSAYAVLYKRTYADADAGADADADYDTQDQYPDGVAVGASTAALAGVGVDAAAVGVGIDTMPYGFYSVAQSKPRAAAAAAARQAAVIAAQQDTAAAAAAAAHRATVTPSSSLLGGFGPQPYSTRMITIHTEDRDLLKYPFENAFEVVLPTVIKNVLSVELADIALPAFFYNVSDYLQNTKLWFSVPNYFTEPVEIAVPAGCYAPADLCSALAKQLNEATAKRLYTLGIYVSPLTTYTQFSVSYNAIERKFTFHSTQDGFVLWFDRQSTYECDSSCQQQQQQHQFTCWKMLRNWGLGYNLGFYKRAYEVATVAAEPTTLQVTSTQIADLDVRNTIYMEIDAFNWIDEIAPFSIATTDFYNGDFNGSVNNAFAKLALSAVSGCYIPVKKFKRVLPHMVEKVGRLKFKFRYHNGIPVDFKHQAFDFSLKFECRFN